MKQKVICPECKQEAYAEFEVTEWMNRMIEFKGEEPFLVRLDIELKVVCPRCGEESPILHGQSGPIPFVWVGP